MAQAPLPDETIIQRVALWNEVGRNTSETARRLGVCRRVVHNTLHRAIERGMLTEADLRDPNTPKAEDYQSARPRKIAPAVFLAPHSD